MKIKIKMLGLILFQLGIFSTCFGQLQFSSKNFKNSFCVAVDKKNSFFISDTIKLLQLKNENAKHGKKPADFATYFNNQDFISFEFERNGQLECFNTIIETWSVETKKGKYSWKFDKKKQLLKLFFNDMVIGVFRPYAKNEMSINSILLNVSSINGCEIRMVRVKE